MISHLKIINLKMISKWKNYNTETDDNRGI